MHKGRRDLPCCNRSYQSVSSFDVILSSIVTLFVIGKCELLTEFAYYNNFIIATAQYLILYVHATVRSYRVENDSCDRDIICF